MRRIVLSCEKEISIELFSFEMISIECLTLRRLVLSLV